MIVLIVYGWTIIWFLWRVQGWLLFLRPSEILMAFAYALATNLAESLVVLGLLVLLSFLLPKEWFHDGFVARGSAAAIAALAYMAFLAYQFQYKSEYPSLRLAGWQLAVPSVAIALLTYGGGRVALLRKALESLADRATIFLYATVPASLVAVLVVVIRSAM